MENFSTINKNKPLGKLLIFIIFFTAFQSISAIVKSYFEINKSIEIYNNVPNISISMHTLLGISIAWSLFYLYSFFSIANKKIYAIQLTKIVLILNPIVSLLVPLLTTIIILLFASGIGGFIEKADTIFNQNLIKAIYPPQVLGEAIGSCIWSLIIFLYLSNSKVVKDIWGDNTRLL